MIRLLARHTGRHVPRPPCGHRGSSGTLYCDEPAGHIGPHVDASEVGTISWPREVRLAIEAPKPEPEPERPSWRHRLAARFADAVALITGLGVFEAETRAAGLPGSCDWGGCDEPATGERWDDEHGWLPVCAEHASDGDEGDDYDPGICPHCGHPGFDGGVCGRCGWGYGYQHAHEAAVAAIYAPGQLPVTPKDDDATDIFSLPRVSARRHARNIWAPPSRDWVQRSVAALMDEYFPPPLKAIEA